MLALSVSAQAQTGIGTTTPNVSAMLDVTSTTKGLLLPRMTAAQRTAVEAPATSLIVYQTDGEPGFYYFNGFQWASLTTNQTVSSDGFVYRSRIVSSLLQTNGYRVIARDGYGNIYGSAGYAVQKVDPSGSISILAGSIGTSGNVNATGTNARFALILGLVCDKYGNVYVAENSTHIRKITPAGVVTNYNTTALASNASGIGIDGAGIIYAASLGRIVRIAPDGTTVTGNGSGVAGNLAIDLAGGFYFIDGDVRIKKVTGTGTVVFAGGNPGNLDGIGSAAKFSNITAMAIDAAGTLYVTDGDNNNIRRITSAGVVTTIAGFAPLANSVVNGTTDVATFDAPTDLVMTPDGTFYVADGSGHIRVIKYQ